MNVVGKKPKSQFVSKPATQTKLGFQKARNSTGRIGGIKIRGSVRGR